MEMPKNWNTIESIIDKTEIFININQRTPQMFSHDEGSEEYELKKRYGNVVTRSDTLELMKIERPDLYERVQHINRLMPHYKYTDEECVTRFEVFYSDNSRNPRATTPKTDEYNLARTYYGRFSPDSEHRKQLAPELDARLRILEAKPGWKKYNSLSDILEFVQTFCIENKWFPIRTSPDTYERYLASGIAKTRKFTPEQNEIIKELRHRYSRNDNVSFPEKIFYHVISCLLNEEVVANQKICGYEADISFPYGGNYYIIQYDGRAYHSKENSFVNDKKANEAHLAAGNKVIRIRELNLPSLNEYSQFSKENYLEIPVNPDKYTQDQINKIVLCILDFACCSNIDVTAYSWNEVIKAARYDSSARKTAISAVCEYLEFILFAEETPDRSSVHRKNKGAYLDNRIKSLLNRKSFEPIELEALALLEFFYENKRRKRNQEAFKDIGGILDFEKGSQFLK